MMTNRILSSKGLAFQKPVGFALPKPRWQRRLRLPSVVLWVSQSRYTRAADRFARFSNRAGLGAE